MEDSEGKRVVIEFFDGGRIEGIVDLYESRYDNEDDDEPYSGQASLCVDCDDGTGCLVFESEIYSIRING